MKIKSPISLSHVLTAAAAALLLTAAGPAAADHHMKSKAKNSQGHSMKKAAARSSGTCDGGGTWQDTQTCRKEAAAAKDAEQRNRLATGEDANFERNRTLRCQGLPAGDRDACVARMAQPSSVSGSVTEGGILYEATQTVPAGSTNGASMNQPPARSTMQKPMQQQQRSMQQRSMQQRKATPQQPPLR